MEAKSPTDYQKQYICQKTGLVKQVIKPENECPTWTALLISVHVNCNLRHEMHDQLSLYKTGSQAQRSPVEIHKWCHNLLALSWEKSIRKAIEEIADNLASQVLYVCRQVNFKKTSQNHMSWGLSICHPWMYERKTTESFLWAMC